MERFAFFTAKQNDLFDLSRNASDDAVAYEAWTKYRKKGGEVYKFICTYGKTLKIRMEAWELIKDKLNDELVNFLVCESKDK